MSELKGKKEKYTQWRQLGMLVMIPFIMGAGPLVGYFLGLFLEELLAWEGTLRYIFLLLGFGAAFKSIYEIVKRTAK